MTTRASEHEDEEPQTLPFVQAEHRLLRRSAPDLVARQDLHVRLVEQLRPRSDTPHATLRVRQIRRVSDDQPRPEPIAGHDPPRRAGRP